VETRVGHEAAVDYIDASGPAVAVGALTRVAGVEVVARGGVLARRAQARVCNTGGDFALTFIRALNNIRVTFMRMRESVVGISYH